MSMKILPKEFTKTGFSYKQLRREGNVALYEQRGLSGGIGYEVILISSHKGYSVGEGGSYIEPAETYPSSSLWGQKGWTYLRTQLDLANRKFDGLVIAEARKADSD